MRRLSRSVPPATVGVVVDAAVGAAGVCPAAGVLPGVMVGGRIREGLERTVWVTGAGADVVIVLPDGVGVMVAQDARDRAMQSIVMDFDLRVNHPPLSRPLGAD